jgi:hypothetical protein
MDDATFAVFVVICIVVMVLIFTFLYWDIFYRDNQERRRILAVPLCSDSEASKVDPEIVRRISKEHSGKTILVKEAVSGLTVNVKTKDDRYLRYLPDKKSFELTKNKPETPEFIFYRGVGERLDRHYREHTKVKKYVFNFHKPESCQRLNRTRILVSRHDPEVWLELRFWKSKTPSEDTKFILAEKYDLTDPDSSQEELCEENGQIVKYDKSEREASLVTFQMEVV